MDQSTRRSRLAFSNLNEQVYELLKQEILDGDHPPGHQLPAGAIAKTLGVSITPVRDALRRLHVDGLVKVLPRRGTFVAGLTRRDAQEIFEIRRMVELAAAERLLDAPPAFAVKMEALLNGIQSLLDEQSFGEFDRYITLDAEFHQRIVDLLHNGRISQLHRELRWSMQVTRVLIAAHHERAHLAVAEHTDVLEAIQDRDVARLQAALLAHLNRAEADLLECMPVDGQEY